MFYTNPSFQ